MEYTVENNLVETKLYAEHKFKCKIVWPKPKQHWKQVKMEAFLGLHYYPTEVRWFYDSAWRENAVQFF